MGAKGQRPAKHFMPVGPIRRILQGVMDERTAAREHTCNYAAESKDVPMGATSSIAFDLYGPEGIVKGQRYLYRVLHEGEWIPFDRADEILTRLGLQQLWHEDPELSEIYDSGVVQASDERDERLPLRRQYEANRTRNKTKHQKTLENIDRLEQELGISA